MFKKNDKIFFTFKIIKLTLFSACTSKTDSSMKGTCYTASECSSKGGSSNGNCASGFY